MPIVLSRTDKIVHDRFGRAYAVCYRNPDGSVFGDLLPGSQATHHTAVIRRTTIMRCGERPSPQQSRLPIHGQCRH